MRITVLAVASLILLLSSNILATVPAASGANIFGFIRDVNTFWGTPGNPTGVSPGDRNIPLTITFRYGYPSAASSIQGLLTLPSGFTLYDGTNETYSSTPGGVSSDSAFQMTFNGIFLSSSLALGLYNFTVNLWAYSGSALILEQNSTVTAYVEGRPQLQFSTSAPSLTAGRVDDVPLSVTNKGSGNASQLSLTVSTSGASILTPLLEIPFLAAGKSASLGVEVYIPSSASGSALSLSVAATYYDPYGAEQSTSQQVGVYILSSNSSLPSVLVSVSPLKSEVRVGTQSKVSFVVKDVGPTSLGSPVLSLAVSSPLVVLLNSSYAVPSGVLRPGESVIYDALVGSSTSATPGFYSASVTVTYLDQSGAEKNTAFSSGLVLAGSIVLVVTSPQVSQGNTTLTVSGEILNEGFSNAYYANVTGSLAGARSTSQADYVGEIDPNTPVPFSLTIGYTPTGSTRTIRISVDVTFKDSLGLLGEYNSSVQTTLRPTSSPLGSSSSTAGSSSGVDLLTYLEVGVMAALVAIGIAGFLYVRRTRTKVGSAEPKYRTDQGVV